MKLVAVQLCLLISMKGHVTMYQYLHNYPKAEKNGWSENVQGICHDDKYWFVSNTGKGNNTGTLWKIPVIQDLASSSSVILKKQYGHHIGDIDHYNGFIFAPIEKDGKPYIAVFSAQDLTFVAKQRIKKGSQFYDCLGWCAVNPQNGMLYTSDHTVISDHKPNNGFGKKKSPIMVYSINMDKIKSLNKDRTQAAGGYDRTDLFSYQGFINIYDINGKSLSRQCMQGGCFDNSGFLHINNGYEKGYANSKGGISVFKVPKIVSKNGFFVRRLASSNQKSGFRYQFTGWLEEPEGLTYWDLDKLQNGTERHPKVCGQLHAIILDNEVFQKDRLYFKHYRRICYK